MKLTSFTKYSDFETLNILKIKCNTIDKKEADGAKKHKTNTANCQNQPVGKYT